jgi:hypothetical protein
MIELALTRIFSVTMFYHFAFLAVSVALFGLSASGVFIYVTPRLHRPERLFRQLGLYSVLFSVVTVASILLLLQIRVGMEYSTENLLLMIAIYLIAAAPFFAAGACLTLAISRLHDDINRVYAADLIGAAAGCLLLVPSLDLFGAPGAMLLAAAFGAAAGLLFALSNQGVRWRVYLVPVGVMIVLVALQAQFSLIDVRFPKGVEPRGVLFSKWNAFSRVAVYDAPHHDWGLSTTYTGPHPDSRYMDIDSSASTPILAATRGATGLDYLRYELTGLAYALKPGGHALIIGPGGGRDIWTALVFGARRVEGVEINPIIAGDVMSGAFREFSGDIYRRPGVTVAIDDGRSYVRRSKERYDLIQASLVDTMGRQLRGRLYPDRKHLYTVEAFVEYMQHLKPDGILTMSRWYDDGFRLVSLARAAADRLGWKGIEDRFFVARQDRLATFILKNSPFTDAEVKQLVESCTRLDFGVVYAPTTPSNPVPSERNDYTRLATTGYPDRFYEDYATDITPTTDDRPFFFYQPQKRNPFQLEWGSHLLFGDGLSTLMTLMMISTAMVALFIVLPLAFYVRPSARSAGTAPPAANRWALATLAYFACLGAGFMLVEIGMMQRFVLFLGHPVYSVTVVLFTLLLGGGIGSAVSRRFQQVPGRVIVICAPLVAVTSVVYALVLPPLFTNLIALSLPVRIVISVALMLPFAIVLGMPLPAGIRLAGARWPAVVAWAWGINGATSVVGATFAIFVAMNWGFTRVAVTGSLVYGVATLIAIVIWRAVEPAKGVSVARLPLAG